MFVFLLNVVVSIVDGAVGLYVLWSAVSRGMKEWPSWVRIPMLVGAVGLVCQSIRCITFLRTGVPLSEYDQFASWIWKDIGLVAIVLSITMYIESEKRKMSEQFWDRSKWIKWCLLLCACVSVVSIDWYAGAERQRLSEAANFKDLEFNWHLAKASVELGGLEVLPVQKQTTFETLDIYCLGADDEATSPFLTIPRFEPTRTTVRESQVDGYQGPRPMCWTEQVKLARLGNTGVGIFKDYRGEDVISAYGLATVPSGETVVVLVEMDVSEAHATAKPNRWDEVLVTICCGTVGVIIFFVHRHREKVMQRMAATEEAAHRVMEKYERLVKEKKESDTDGDVGDMLDAMATEHTIADWKVDDLLKHTDEIEKKKHE